MLEYKSIKTVSGTSGYVSLGKGYPLIMVVGYSGTLFHWHSKFVHDLAKHYTVYLVDNRRIGLSDSNNEESITGFAKDIVDFMDALSLEKPFVLGWSMGGVVVQELMKDFSHKIAGSILMSTVPQIPHVNPEFFAFAASASNMPINEYKEGMYYFFFSHRQYNKSKDELTSNALKLNNYHYRFESNARELQDRVIPFWDGLAEKDLQKIKLPTLLLWAKNDLVVPFKSALFFIDNLNLSKLVVYSEGGHFLLQDNYKQVANDIINFISNQM